MGIKPSRIYSYTLEEKATSPPFFETLKQDLLRYQAPRLPHLPPLTGGWVGYIGYDMIREIERLPDAPPDQTGIPDAVLGEFTTIIAFDHLKNELWLIHTVLKDSKPLALLYQQATDHLEELHIQLQESSLQLAGFQAQVSKLEGNFSQRAFEAAVQQARDYIFAGDAFQIVLSQRFRIPFAGDTFQIYRALRSLNPSPYMFYLQFDDLQLIGSSPEILVQQKGEIIQVVPIAGTRWRGQNAAEDEAIAAELLNDPKELAEHTMLVDLARNDVGRVSIPGTVQVKDYRTVEKYSHVMHIISRVYGTIQKEQTAVDTFKAVFPAGTVSGAPKIRAMKIIDELEPERRNFYAGGLGYFNFSGEMDHCITIRTILASRGALHLQAGAGIVADSIPQNEFQETINKAMALRRAIELANKEAK